MALPIIVLGGGGHAKVVIATLLMQGRQMIGYSSLEQNGQPILGVSRLGGDEVIFQFGIDEVRLANGIGAVEYSSLRAEIYEQLSGKEYVFEKVIHPSAVVASDIQLDDGVQIMARAVVQPGTQIGINSIINTGASIDHDCVVGCHVHIAPGAILCGKVRIEDGAYIGAGATIIQGRSVGARSIVGAGAVVLENVPPNVTVAGIPARVIKGKVSSN